MYGIFDNLNLIAIHEDLDVINEYISQRNDSDSLRVVKFSKKKSKEISSSEVFENVYLVRYKDKYLPLELYDTIKELDYDHDYDYRICRDILFRIISDNEVSEKEAKILRKALLILTKHLETIDEIDEDIIRSSKKLIEEYRSNIK